MFFFYRSVKVFQQQKQNRGGKILGSNVTTITDPEAVCPEIYYILGMVYYNQRTKESAIKAMEAFNKSLELLNNGFPVSHGYHADDLRERQEANINNITKLLKLK